MFRKIGNGVTRYWPVFFVGWVCMLVALRTVAPPWKTVVGDGEFRYLPADVPSRQAEEAFQKAFPGEQKRSRIVVVVRRESGPQGLTDGDRKFVEEVLKPRLMQIAVDEGGLAGSDADNPDDQADSPTSGATNAAVIGSKLQAANQPRRSVIAGIHTETDKAIGHLLHSEDNKASLVLIDLTTEFTEYRNEATIQKIEKLIVDLRESPDKSVRTPPGLDLALSGSAAVGRDMREAARKSAGATEFWTVLLVILLLILIYRAPVLAVIPLISVVVAVKSSLYVLALMAEAGWIGLFNGIETYVTVVMYGAGVDYCVFLMARYTEELDAGTPYREAVANAVEKVGAALAASAGTTMCGIGMMVFADFEKFRQAGIAMSLSLVFVLCTSLTFTPSLLRLAGRWTFWPDMRVERIAAAPGWLSPTSLVAQIIERDWFRGTWDRVGKLILSRPATIWLGSLVVMTPFAIVGVQNFHNCSYGLLRELPDDSSSVVGTAAVQAHFPAGTTGPVTILVESPTVDFSSSDGIEAIEQLSLALDQRRESLGIADIRSVAFPLGTSAREKQQQSLAKLKTLRRLAEKRVRRKRAVDYYVSHAGPLADHATRLEAVFQDDPFSRHSLDRLNEFEQTIKSVLPPELRASGRTQLYFLGTTPSVRDLKSVTGSDRVRIDILVLVGVFLVLVMLLRKPAICAYLIASVFFSYLVTLGVTFTVFYALDPDGFAGLDWKVPMFLFTILIAVGEDYNIYLITRIEEEQARHGPINGIAVALSKTGSIISSCGFIMAGTFSSLMAGYLLGMTQLGFALTFGILLDTFVVRPILVPAYLVLLRSGRFGQLGRFLGQREPVIRAEVAPALEVGGGGEEISGVRTP